MSGSATWLKEFLGSARWFGGKGRSFRVLDVRRAGTLGSPAEPADTPVVGIELVTVGYDDGGTEVYQVPLAYYAEPQERLEHALVGAWDDPTVGPSCAHVLAYDALHDRAATALWLQAFASDDTVGDLVFHRVPGHDLDLETHSTLFSGEQSNSSVMFGEDSLMKVFRKLTVGRNPDIDVHAALTEAHSEHVAALYGWLELSDETTGPVQLAMLQQFLRTASDGWDLALASVRDLFAEADLHADEVGGDFAAEAERLGRATAEVHDALREAFPSDTWGSAELETMAGWMRRRLDEAVQVVPALAEHADGLRSTYAEVAQLAGPVIVQRVHGDFHLGQTLRTVLGWKIVDFEGEPAKPLHERVRPDSVWRDVAGMLRSLDYAAHAVEADVHADEEHHAQIAYRAAEWAERNRTAYLHGYIEASGLTVTGDLSASQQRLLRAYEADKAVYEAVYEARNRPSWLPIPMGAIARLA
ncbi:MAG: maltokinase N-terminal cap-like domain-containing protein [Nocardioidaceae bacterium]